MTNVLFFRGWLGIYSLGLNELASRIKTRNAGVTTRVYEWDEWPKAVSDTERWKDDFVLVGHSYGVAAMFDFAKTSGKRVRHFIALDPSQYVWLTPYIGNNVPPRGAEGTNFYQKPILPFAIGGVTIPGFDNRRIHGVSHAGMDDDPGVQRQVIELIEKHLG